MKKNKFWIGIIGAIVLMSVAAMIVLHVMQKSGDEALVYQDGKLIYTLPLNQDRTITIYAPNGGYNVVEVKDGTVRVSEASCPDQICVKHGPTTKTADPIVCLPNKLVVQIVSSRDSDLDGVTR